MGSQAILGRWKEVAAPDRVTMSNEADIAFFVDPEEIKADTVMGVLGPADAEPRATARRGIDDVCNSQPQGCVIGGFGAGTPNFAGRSSGWGASLSSFILRSRSLRAERLSP